LSISSSARAHRRVGPAARGQQRQHHVLHRGERGQQVVKLEHEADGLRAQQRECLVGQVFGFLPGEKEFAGAGLVQQADDVEQGALA
jgi:hypothetical protein